MAQVTTYSRNVKILWSKAPPEAFEELVSAYADLIRTEVRRRMASWATIVREYMKQEAPWQDQTSQARRGLGTRVGGSQAGSWLILFHTAPHGVYLEGFNPKTGRPMLRGSQYAIVEPTFETVSQVIWNDIWKDFQRR